MFTPPTAAAAHKEATGCSGKRDRTAFVGRGAFDERTFLSDYRFLEEASGVPRVARGVGAGQQVPQERELCCRFVGLSSPGALRLSMSSPGWGCCPTAGKAGG